MIENLLNDAIQKISFTRNEFGERVYNGVQFSTIRGRIREQTDLSRNNQMELVETDATGWFLLDEDVREGDILRYDGQYYRVERLLKAREMDGQQLHFKKALLQREKGAIS